MEAAWLGLETPLDVLALKSARFAPTRLDEGYAQVVVIGGPSSSMPEAANLAALFT